VSKKNKNRASRNAKKQSPLLKQKTTSSVPDTQPARPDHGANAAGQLVQVQQAVSVTHSGPTPAPWILEQYEKLDPGRTAKLFALAEKQAHHRMMLEKQVIWSDIARSWAGLFSATLLSACVIGLAAWVAYLNYPTPACLMVAAVIGVDLFAFYLGKTSQSRERIERAHALAERKRR
jgi:uncharacterized membrane protein